MDCMYIMYIIYLPFELHSEVWPNVHVYDVHVYDMCTWIDRVCTPRSWACGGSVCVCVCLCVSVSMYVCMCVYVCVYIYVYLYIYKIECSSRQGYVRMRVVFFARPRDPRQLPKSVPDYESAGAAWVSLQVCQVNTDITLCLCVCVCMCVCECMYVCIYIYIYMSIHMCVYMYNNVEIPRFARSYSYSNTSL